ncbi:MAG: SdrD B-like domain-containing protein [Planctomycetales bacterium]
MCSFFKDEDFSRCSETGTRGWERTADRPGGRQIHIDSTGAIVGTTVTDKNGMYHFDNLALGTYRVKEVLPPGAVQVKAPTLIALTRG